MAQGKVSLSPLILFTAERIVLSMLECTRRSLGNPVYVEKEREETHRQTETSWGGVTLRT